MTLLLFLGILSGILGPTQTSVNSRLRKDVVDPYLSSLVSFALGTIILIAFNLLTTGHLLISPRLLNSISWWGYLGGIFATISLTANILLFPVLGSVQTVILPMVGELVTSVIIDNFGWFNASVRPLSPLRLIGIVLVVVSLIFVVVLPNNQDSKKQSTTHQSQHKILWQIGGIFAGVCYGIEAAINGYVGKAVASPIQATLITFLVSSILLFITVSARGNLKLIKNVMIKRTPTWAYLGGLLGSLSIFLNSFLVPRIGNGTAIVLLIAGQLLASLLIDNFGWLESRKRPIKAIQVVGLLFLAAGVAII